MPNIGDLARRTGLSTATVSRFLNGHRYVSQEARQAIEIAIREMGYRPNSAARSLRSGHTGRILLIVHDAARPYYANLIASSGAAALARGYDIVVQQSLGNSDWYDRLIEQIGTRSVDGLILAARIDDVDGFVERIGDLPVISIDQSVHRRGFPAVYLDHTRSTLDGLNHLYERGARTIIAVRAPDGDNCASSKPREEAYRQFAADHPDCDVRVTPVGDASIAAGFRLFEDLPREALGGLGVFAAADEVAAGLLHAAREAGVEVPAQLRILGFDDRPIAEVLGISTIRQPINRIGAIATERILDAAESGGRLPRKRSMARHLLVERSTT